MLKAANDDIAQVKEQLARAEIQSARTRSLLRKVLAGGRPGSEQALVGCLTAAAAHAAERGEEALWGQDVLAATGAPDGRDLQVSHVKGRADESRKAVAQRRRPPMER
jgi:hypothetical protein